MGLQPAQEETPESLVSLPPHHVKEAVCKPGREGPHRHDLMAPHGLLTAGMTMHL